MLTLVVIEDVGAHKISLHFDLRAEFVTYLPFQSGSVSETRCSQPVGCLIDGEQPRWESGGKWDGDYNDNGSAAAVERMIATMVERGG